MPVLPRALEIQGEITAIRRDIHAHPELAYEENRTSDIVAAKLAEWGLEVTRGPFTASLAYVDTNLDSDTHVLGRNIRAGVVASASFEF